MISGKQQTHKEAPMKSRQTIHGIGIVFFFLLILPLISEAGDILPADGTASGYFGGSVSISDVYAVAGASGDNSSKGAVYVSGTPAELKVMCRREN